MTIIKCTEIPYLNEEVLEKYKNVIIVSSEGLIMKMNSLILCALSQALKMAFHEDDDDHTIVTEFSLEELKQVKEFCMRGSCNAMSESILEAFGLLKKGEIKLSHNNIDEIQDESFSGISNSKSVMKSLENSIINSEISVKSEHSEIKEEPNAEFELNLEYSSDEYLPSQVKYNNRKKNKRITKKLYYDVDWELGKPSKIKTKKSNGKLNQRDKKLESTKQFSDEDLIGVKRKSDSKEDIWVPGKYKIPKMNSETLNQGTKLSDMIADNANQNELLSEDFELLKTLFGFPNSLEEYRKQPKSKRNYAVKNKNNDILEILPSNVQCPNCQKILQNRNVLRSHMLKIHSEHFQCPICGTAKSVNDVKEFKKHVFEHIAHDKGIWKQCIQCGFLERRTISFSRHLQKRGPLHNDECSQCSKKLSSYKEYQDHVNTQHYGIWKYKCGFEICGEFFDDETQYLKHINIHTRKMPQEEKTEVKKVPKKSGHLENKQKGFCHECGKTFNYIMNHIRIRHSQVLCKCELCDQTFKSLAELYQHKGKVHFKTQCPNCGLMVSNNNLKYHILQKHTPDNEKPHQCHQCGKGFVQRYLFDDHMNIHTGDKPHKCKYCPASFASKGTMLMHQKGHLGIKRKPKKS